jgi:hypothetical protein
MFKRTAALLLIGAALTACSGDDSGGTVATTTSEKAASVTTTQDPYETYLRLKPPGEETLSREDAQTRAYLGCNNQWAPGTTDRALADAYRPTRICN